MLEFENKNVTVCSTRAFILTTKGLMEGDHIYVDSTPNRDRKFKVPEGGIWFMEQDDSFQNKDNFVRGIKYITELAHPKAMRKCLWVLDMMTDNYDKKTDMFYCNCLSFFCEIGVWKDKDLRQDFLYHKDFPKYLANCMDSYLGAIGNDFAA